MAVEEYFSEIKALVPSFLTTMLNDRPNGYTLHEFCREFPEKCEEPENWYIKAGKKNPLECLKMIGDPVCVTQSYNTYMISLNKRSDKVDSHMADLIINQKPSGKKKRNNTARPHYLRARDSFDMNRRYSNSSSNDRHMNARLSYNDQSSRNDNSGSRTRSSPFAQTNYSNTSRHFSYNNENIRPAAPGDPRSRSSANSMIPPQVRLPSSAPVPPRQPAAAPTPQPPRPQPISTSRSSAQNSAPTTPKPITREPEDPTIESKKSHLRNLMLKLLTRKYPEIKLLYLPSIFELETKEKIDPPALGHKSLTSLLLDPFFSEYFKINYVSPLVTVSARNMANGKENIATNDGNRVSGLINGSDGFNANSSEVLTDRSNYQPSIKEKLKAIRPFNLDTMLHTLEPLSEVKDVPLGNNSVEDCIKFRTMRIIFKSQNPKLTLRLDDWELKYQQEWNCKSKIQLRDFGFKTQLEFFKYLATELPIKIRLNNHDDWVAVGDLTKMSSWLKKKMDEGCYRAITAIDAKYEQIAFPNETYNYSGLKDLPVQEYYPSIIMSVKKPHKMWVQIRTQKRIEDHLSIEASLICYDDYNRKGFFNVPDEFLRPGFPCVAYDEVQQRWCRAVIVNVTDLTDDNKEGITAFLVDYAITKSFSKSQLLCILKSHLKRPIGLVYAQLFNVSDQSATARRILQEYTSPPVTLACKVVNSVEVDTGADRHLPKCCYSVTLIDTRQGRDCNIADDINSYSLNPEE